MKLNKVVQGAEYLSLGISIVIAILIGIGLGIWLKSMFGYSWLLWLGVFWGVSAAILNIYIIYKKQMKSLEELKDENRYKKPKYDKDED